MTTKTVTNGTKPVPKKHGYWSKLGMDLIKNKWLYIMLIPGVIYFLVFKYLPMWGVIIGFEDYSPFLGPFKSAWKGLYWFQKFFSTKKWIDYLSNTLILSFMSIVFTFPAPIILALMLNEVRSMRYKKLTQTLLYMPHFISIVIVVSITYVIFGTDGIIYKLTAQMLGHKVDFLGDPGIFRWMIVGQSIWKETGWGTIIFLAALTNVDTQLYEAAMIDGASRMQRIWHITLPGIRSTIVVLLIMNLGKVMGSNFERLDVFANTQVRDYQYQLAIYIYEKGLANSKFSMATAVGLFQSLVGLMLVLISDRFAKALGEDGLL